MFIINLTDNEFEILNLLWAQGRPLSKTEIIEFSTQRSWKPSSVHGLLNSLISKGAIVVDGFVKTGTNYGRAFAAAKSREDYLIMHLKENLNTITENKSKSILKVFSAFLDDEILEEDTIYEIEQMISKKKKELEM